MKGDRIGLIAFAGNAFLQCPLTLDHQAFINTLKNLEIGTIKAGGTNLASPIDEASRSFSKEDRDKFLILISDGEDLEGEGLKRAKEANKQGIKIYTIGIGSPEGARIPTDSIDSPARNFLLNPEGKTVITRLDKDSLQAISNETNGKYYLLVQLDRVWSQFSSYLNLLEKKKFVNKSLQKYPLNDSNYFLLLAILLLLCEKLTPLNKRSFANGVSVCLALTLCFWGGCIKQDNIKRAEDAVKNKDWSEAAKFYDLETNATADDLSYVKAKMMLNAGLAHFRCGNFLEAKERLEQTIDLSMDFPDLQSKALNELGNLFYKKTNEWLDQQNVMQARRSWNKALEVL